MISQQPVYLQYNHKCIRTIKHILFFLLLVAGLENEYFLQGNLRGGSYYLANIFIGFGMQRESVTGIITLKMLLSQTLMEY